MPSKQRTGSSVMGSLSNISKKVQKSKKKSFVVDQDTEEYLDPTRFISTGAPNIDIAISNKRNGGIPVGKMTVIAGDQGMGKSVMCQHICKNAIDGGGIALYFDFERALHRGLMGAIGILNHPNFEIIESSELSLEEVISISKEYVSEIRNEHPDIDIVIVWDSLNAPYTEKQLKELKKDKVSGYNTDRAILYSQKMNELHNFFSTNNVAWIGTSQVRYSMDALSMEKYRVALPKSVEHYVDLVIVLKKSQGYKLKVGDDYVGTKVKCVHYKSRFGPEWRPITYNFYFSSGIDAPQSFLSSLKEYNIVKSGGRSFDYEDKETGESLKVSFTSATFEEEVYKNKDYREYLIDKLFEVMEFKYDSNKRYSEEDIKVVDQEGFEDGSFEQKLNSTT